MLRIQFASIFRMTIEWSRVISSCNVNEVGHCRICKPPIRTHVLTELQKYGVLDADPCSLTALWIESDKPGEASMQLSVSFMH